MHITLHCRKCGNQDIPSDVSAAWNAEAQTWDIIAIFDASDCDTCDTETKLIERPVTSHKKGVVA
ncbi:MAG: hypothetical protein AAF366_21540 [Pseudomonadota bacterium]